KKYIHVPPTNFGNYQPDGQSERNPQGNESPNKNSHPGQKLIQYKEEDVGPDGRTHTRNVKKWVPEGTEENYFPSRENLRRERWTTEIRTSGGKKYIKKRKWIYYEVPVPAKHGRKPHNKKITRWIDYDSVEPDGSSGEPAPTPVPKQIHPKHRPRKHPDEEESPEEPASTKAPHRRRHRIRPRRHHKVKRIKYIIVPGKKKPIQQVQYIDVPDEETTGKPGNPEDYYYDDEPEKPKRKKHHPHRRIKRIKKIRVPGKKEPQEIVQYIDIPEDELGPDGKPRHPKKSNNPEEYFEYPEPAKPYSPNENPEDYEDYPEKAGRHKTTHKPKRRIKRVRKIRVPGKKEPQEIVQYVDVPEDELGPDGKPHHPKHPENPDEYFEYPEEAKPIGTTENPEDYEMNPQGKRHHRTTHKPKRRIKRIRKIRVPGKKEPQEIVQYVDVPEDELGPDGKPHHPKHPENPEEYFEYPEEAKPISTTENPEDYEENPQGKRHHRTTH
ncbi:hypothetical protein C0J52_24642, partial [Blattella germanica]